MTHKILILLAGIGGAVVVAMGIAVCTLAVRSIGTGVRKLHTRAVESRSVNTPGHLPPDGQGFPSYYMDQINWKGFPNG